PREIHKVRRHSGDQRDRIYVSRYITTPHTGDGHPLIRKLVTFVHNPTAWSSHTQTATTTTMFKMVLMLEAIGMYLLIRYKATPTTINTMTRFSNGILQCSWNQEEAFRCPIARRRVPRGLGSVRNAPDAPDKLCNAAPFRWAVVVETTKAALRAALHGSAGATGTMAGGGGDQGRHPSRTARTRKDPFPTRSAYSATVMASLTLG